MDLKDDRRSYIRHPLSYPLSTRIIRGNSVGTSVGSSAGKDDVWTESMNIGAGGVQFISGRSIERGTEVGITIEVEKRKFELDGYVIRCEPSENGGFITAVAFNSPSALLKARMAEQVVRMELFKERLERRYGVKLDFAAVAKEWIKRYSTSFARRYDV